MWGKGGYAAALVWAIEVGGDLRLGRLECQFSEMKGRLVHGIETNINADAAWDALVCCDAERRLYHLSRYDKIEGETMPRTMRRKRAMSAYDIWWYRNGCG